MDKLEKAIKAFECCEPFNRQCDKCPYDEDCFHDQFSYEGIVDMVELLKEQKETIDKYRKADTFLAVHGWQWKDYGTEHCTEQFKDGEQE